MEKKIFCKTLLVFFLFSLVFPKGANAYLDPGNVSFLTQIVVASLAGGAYLVATSWKKIKSILSKFFPRPNKSDTKDVPHKDSS
jgi:hypothetical protein